MLSDRYSYQHLQGATSVNPILILELLIAVTDLLGRIAERDGFTTSEELEEYIILRNQVREELVEQAKQVPPIVYEDGCDDLL